MALNGISTLSTKQAKQEAKLALAAIKRAATGRRSNLDITQLPTQYSGNDIIDNPNDNGLVEGRPWLASPPGLPVNFYGTTSQFTPIGDYTIGEDGGIILAYDAYVDIGAPLNSSVFTITIDADLSTGTGDYWNVIWGNESYFDNLGLFAYWGGSTAIVIGTPLLPVELTTPDITQPGRRLYTFVINDTDVSFYIDGALIGTGVTGSTTFPNNLFIGGRHDNGGGNTAVDARGGTYYSVKVTDAVLTDEQVYNEYVSIRGL